jgi:hypothetical protein
MFFKGSLSIDPSALTQIQRIPPQNAFKRILYYLSLSLVSERQERETFTAVSILQQLYRVFAQLGVDDLVRLSHDGIDFYLDNQNEDKDLKATLDKYELETNEAMSVHFEQLNMVLQHKKDSFIYLFHICINRTHAVGKYPIQIEVNALLNEFAGATDISLKKALQEKVFKNQNTYNSFLLSKQAEFDHFLDTLVFQLRASMQLDDVKNHTVAQIIAPKIVTPLPTPATQARPNQAASTRHYLQNSPIFHGYDYLGTSLAYTYLWGQMCHSQHIQVQNVEVVSETGTALFQVGDKGFEVGDTNFFDSSFDLDKRLAEIGYHQNPDGSIICDNPATTKQLGIYDMLTSYSEAPQHNTWDDLTNGNFSKTSGTDSNTSDSNTSSASSWDFFTSNDSSSSANDSSSSSCSSANDSSSSSCSSASCSSSSCSSSSCSS